jgi:hypothetical protein
MRGAMHTRSVIAASLLLAVVLATGEIGPVADRAGAATADPCSGLKQAHVASAFGVKEIDLVTRGKGDFGRSCFFSAPVRGGSCATALAVFITTNRYRDKTAAGEAYAVDAADGQSLPKGDPPEGQVLATEALSGLGSAAYFTNRRGGTVVVLDGKSIRAFGGGFVVPSTALGCDPAALRSVNRDALTKLAAKVAPPRKAAAPSQ